MYARVYVDDFHKRIRAIRVGPEMVSKIHWEMCNKLPKFGEQRYSQALVMAS